ncbi:MAG: hypothetical protein KatS3mg077_0487 [Candidatus Binatia bacterium]|nr:MAG: hypothetical protein KatS3mg077_0487 [Candidatus Binatia bacterium]
MECPYPESRAESWPVVIIGAGPAGTATALFLAELAPDLASQTLVLDRAVHPRFKVCAGGLIPQTRRCLNDLGVDLNIPHVTVARAIARTPVGSVEHVEESSLTVVRRDEFDALLVSQCMQKGVRVRQAEKALDVREEADHVRVVTERALYRASIVVGADGSGSLVRRRLFGRAEDTVGRAIMSDIPLTDATMWERAEGQCEFDFRAVADGLRGYAWIFPCRIQGALYWNIGVYASQAQGSGFPMRTLLARTMSNVVGSSSSRVYAYPIRLYRPGVRIARRHALLVGDAAGVDPLMGEGISFAMEYGRVAAETIVAAWKRGDCVVAEYQQRVEQSWLGRKLRRLSWLESMMYGAMSPLWFRIATRNHKLREVGLRWYNGVDGLDRMTVFEALRRLGRSRGAGNKH